MALAVGQMDVFKNRFRDLQKQEDSSLALVDDILAYCERLETTLRQETDRLSGELRNTLFDLEDARQSRRGFQQDLQTLRSHLEWMSQENDNLKNRNPYVLLLIDGDGLIFQEQWIKQGIEGGKNAAYALRNAIAEQCNNQAGDIEVVAKVVANLTGLAKAMFHDGCIDSAAEVRDFALGFTQAKSSFDFIDVGYGKERADSKIKETTRWNLRNYNCKQILLGISHDAGYAPFLDEILQDADTRRRVTLLEGVPTVKEIVSTNMNILNLHNDLFRSSKLVDRAAAANAASQVARPEGSAGSVQTSPPAAFSYAGATKVGSPPPPQLTLPLGPRSANAASRQKRPAASASTTTTAATWNPGPRGLDEPIPAFSAQAMEAVKKRKENKLCNNYYLRKTCVKGDECSFVHDARPSQDEVNAVALLARLNPCMQGQDCDVKDCIYGHNCPSVKDGVCQHPFCRYSEELHPAGTKWTNPPAYARRGVAVDWTR